MVIRKLQDNDYSEWFFLWKAYLEFYETTLNESIYKETFRRLISLEHNNQGAVVAEVDKKLVGLAHYIIHPHNWKFEDVIYPVIGLPFDRMLCDDDVDTKMEYILSVYANTAIFKIQNVSLISCKHVEIQSFVDKRM